MRTSSWRTGQTHKKNVIIQKVKEKDSKGRTGIDVRDRITDAADLELLDC